MIGKPQHLQRKDNWTACGCQSSLLSIGTANGVNCLRCRKTQAYLDLRAKERRELIKKAFVDVHQCIITHMRSQILADKNGIDK